MALSSSIQIESRKKAEPADIAKIAAVLILLLAGALYLLTGVGTLGDTEHRGGPYRIAALWAMAYCAGGFLVGFLFGIPRVLQGNDVSSSSKEKSPRQGYAQRVNTNLEQISDWLTKIIVGLGLVQLRKIPQNLHDAATWMARGFTPAGGDIGQAASFSTSVIILFSVTGFVGGYLVTRIFIAGAFRRADTETTETLSVSGVSDDDAKKALAKFWKPDGKKADPAREKLLIDWMTKNGLITKDRKISISLFINTPEYARERAQAVQDLSVQ
jgi:hypothetical protein